MNVRVMVAVLVGVLGLAGLAGAQEPTAPGGQQIKVDGSSTVFPITQAAAKAFKSSQTGKAEISVAVSGTSGGFKKFCAGQTDISNASRPILLKEMEACKQAGVAYIELPVAVDALTVVVNPKNDWAEAITLQELKKMWEPDAQKKVTRWKQVRASWPDRPLALYGPGQDSGTFDYFTEAAMGKPGVSRTDYTASEDDDVLVQGVSKDPNALGYFGYAYYEANKERLKALAIDNGKGPVTPSKQTVEKNQYRPFSRPLFIYVNSRASQEKPDLRAFVDFYLKNAKRLVSLVGYIPLADTGYQVASGHFYKGKVGTVYGGQTQLNLTIDELLRRDATF